MYINCLIYVCYLLLHYLIIISYYSFKNCSNWIKFILTNIAFIQYFPKFMRNELNKFSLKMRNFIFTLLEVNPVLRLSPIEVGTVLVSTILFILFVKYCWMFDYRNITSIICLSVFVKISIPSSFSSWLCVIFLFLILFFRVCTFELKWRKYVSINPLYVMTDYIFDKYLSPSLFYSIM